MGVQQLQQENFTSEGNKKGDLITVKLTHHRVDPQTITDGEDGHRVDSRTITDHSVILKWYL